MTGEFGFRRETLNGVALAANEFQRLLRGFRTLSASLLVLVGPLVGTVALLELGGVPPKEHLRAVSTSQGHDNHLKKKVISKLLLKGLLAVRIFSSAKARRALPKGEELGKTYCKCQELTCHKALFFSSSFSVKSFRNSFRFSILKFQFLFSSADWSSRNVVLPGWPAGSD